MIETILTILFIYLLPSAILITWIGGCELADQLNNEE